MHHYLISNYDCYDRGAVFSLPEKEEQKKQWIKFSNRKDISSIKRVNICCRHFADNLQKKGPKRTQLLHVSTIIPVTREKENLPPNAIFETIKTPRKPPRKKDFSRRTDETSKKSDVIKYLDDINKEKMKNLDECF